MKSLEPSRIVDGWNGFLLFSFAFLVSASVWRICVIYFLPSFLLAIQIVFNWLYSYLLSGLDLYSAVSSRTVLR
jgi:hypothetical protein